LRRGGSSGTCDGELPVGLHVLMLGPDLRALGGIAACARLLAGRLAESSCIARFEYVALAPRLRTSRREKVGTAARGYLNLMIALTRRPDIVHVHTSRRGDLWRNAPAMCATRLWGRQLVLHVHPANAFAEFIASGPPWLAGLKLRLVRSAALVIAPSREGMRALAAAGVDARRTAVLPNPIDTAAFAGRPLEERDAGVTYLGWLIPPKGVDDLVFVLPALIAEHPGLRTSFYGPYGADRVRGLLDDLGVAGATVGDWIDGRDKVALLGRSRVIALPSYSEGLPVVLLEALASGTPIVSTRVGGIPEAVPEGEAGLLVEPGDRRALKDSIACLLTDDVLWQRMSTCAGALAWKYDADAVVTQLLKLYDRVDARSAAGRETSSHGHRKGSL